jgi:hypothetical protein
MNQWQPFDTAPTDGTDILVYREDAGVFMAAFRPSAGDPGENGPQMNGEERWFYNYGCDLTGKLPSHWMPTPDPPEVPYKTSERNMFATDADGMEYDREIP